MDLVHSPALIVKRYLLSLTGPNAIGVDPDTNKKDPWPIFHNGMPDDEQTNDRAIAVYNTTGVKDGRDMRTGETFEHQGIMVRTRAMIAEDGWKQAAKVSAAFDTVKRTLVDIDGVSYRIHGITKTAPIINAGQEPDKKRRWSFTVNALVTVTKES